jgi:hypothetical protein
MTQSCPHVTCPSPYVCKNGCKVAASECVMTEAELRASLPAPETLLAYAGIMLKPYRDIRGGLNQPSEIQKACAIALTLAAMPSFQARVAPWMKVCFPPEVCLDHVERNHRFLEEALELVQARGCSRAHAHQLVSYVFDRPAGEPTQEVGGVMVTLAALCIAVGDLDMHQAAETELARIWTKIDAIRAKQATKPKHSPLPSAAPAIADDVGGGL